MLNPHDLITTAEYSFEQAIPTIIGISVAIISFFLKDLVTANHSEQSTVRKEIRDIMIEVGRLEKSLEALEKDVDAIGQITRNLRAGRNE